MGVSAVKLTDVVATPAKGDDFKQFDAPTTPSGAPATPDPPPGADYGQVMTGLRAQFGANTRHSLDDLEAMTMATIAALPPVDEDAVRAELRSINIPVYDDPTPAQLSRGLADVQAFKDRVGALANTVERVYMVRKRMLEMLFDANQAVSSASSVDKRRGEAQLRWPMLQLDLVNVEALRLELTTVMQNLRSKGDVLSRQASILQMQIQLGEHRTHIPREYSELRAETEAEGDNVAGVTTVDWHNI